MTLSTSETGPGIVHVLCNRRVGCLHVEVTGSRTAVDFAH